MASSRKIQRKLEERKRKRSAKAKSTASTKSKRKDISLDELHAIIERAKSALSSDDQAKLSNAVDTLAYLTQELDTKGVSIRRLRKIIFGSSSEKTRDVVGEDVAATASADAAEGGAVDEAAASDTGRSAEPQSQSEDAAKPEPTKKPKAKGHGRNPASAYTGAARTSVPHESLKAKDSCPECIRGKVYPMKEPAVLVRVHGTSPLAAEIVEKERLRCNLCGRVFTAKSPPGVGDEKYDETAAALIALLKYGAGLPFNRIERLEQSLGFPLPASTNGGKGSLCLGARVHRADSSGGSG